MTKDLTLILVCALALFAGTAKADVVGLKTTKAAGDKLTIALNAGVTATLTWGNGTTETFAANGAPQNLTVQADTLTLETTMDITALYLPSNELTALNVSGAPKLEKLICPDNALTALDVSKNTVLQLLDCQNNSLTTLDVKKCTALAVLNCSKNELTTLTYATSPKFTALLCADNQLDTLTAQNRFTTLQQLWCQHNSLTQLNLSKTTQLQAVYAFSNKLTDIELGSQAALADIWVDSNQLDSLDLSGAPALVGVSADHNGMKKVIWDRTCKSTLQYAYLHNNALFFNSFPTVYNKTSETYLIDNALSPQDDFALFDSIPVNQEYTLANYVAKNGWSISLNGTISLKNSAGTELIKGTDYTVTLNKYTFLTEQTGVYFEETSANYPSVSLRTKPFNVYDPETTGIADVQTTTDTWTYRTANGLLTIESASAQTVQIYTLAGACVVREKMAAGTRTWPLPSGFYLVNGKKIIIP